MKFWYTFKVSALQMIFKFPDGYPVFTDTIDNAMEGYLDWGLGDDLEDIFVPIDGEVDPEFYNTVKEHYFDTDILGYFTYDTNSIEVVDAELVDEDCFVTYRIIVDVDMEAIGF